MENQILSNGTEQFTPIIDKLGNITTEFVPYLIYIAIAILGITLSFKAIKYILGYLKGNANDAIGMKERRRRRRQQRRKTYNYDDVQNAERKSDYYYIGKGKFKKRTTQRWKRFGGNINSFNQS